MPAPTQYFVIYLLDTMHKSLPLPFLWLCLKKDQILLVSLIVPETYLKRRTLGCNSERLISQREAKLKCFSTKSAFYIICLGQLSTIWASQLLVTALSAQITYRQWSSLNFKALEPTAIVWQMVDSPKAILHLNFFPKSRLLNTSFVPQFQIQQLENRLGVVWLLAI